VQYAFKHLRRSLKWCSRGNHPAPRIHDLRHSFICRRLERWYAEGQDVDCNILALSTFVGHAKVTDTYWYLTATPALLALAAKRFASRAGGGA
jgi:integrase